MTNDNNDNFFEELLKPKKDKTNKNNLLDNLYTIPKKDKGANRPTFQYYEPNIYQQADLLFLPDDTGYKYALVVADIGSRCCDAEPIKTKSNNDVEQAFKAIYKRKILLPCKIIMVDPGSEFKGSVNTYLTSLKIRIKTNVKDRHRQNAIVERTNQTIGTLIHKRQAAQEILTGETSRAWVKDLPAIIRAMNKKVASVKRPIETNNPRAVGDSSILLHIGDTVRVMLEVPQDVANGTKLHGTFRSGDIRWNRATRTIVQVLIGPNKPPLYLLNNINGATPINPFDTSTAYTKNQLQLIKPNESLPNFKQISAENDKFIIDDIIGKKTEKNKIFYKIHWKGYDSLHDTWEPSHKIIEDVPLLVKEYEYKHKVVVPVVNLKQQKHKTKIIMPPEQLRRSGRSRVGVDRLIIN